MPIRKFGWSPTQGGNVGADSGGESGDRSMQIKTDMPILMEHTATNSAIHTIPSFRNPPLVDEPPASPTKDAIREREDLILKKRPKPKDGMKKNLWGIIHCRFLLVNPRASVAQSVAAPGVLVMQKRRERVICFWTTVFLHGGPLRQQHIEITS
ncbi:hypothetical protein V8B97DRAFT_2007231 [Scleroderma yunnanense]